MEGRRGKFSRRLLKLFFIVYIFLFFSGLSFAADYSELRVLPKKEYYFTNEPCYFELIVPGVSPSLVRVTIQSLPDGCQFISSDKEQIVYEDEHSTLVTLCFEFSKSGTFTLPRLAARIGFGGYALHFDSVKIIQNPQTLLPEFFFTFPEGKNFIKGKRTPVLLCARYFKAITAVNVQLDEKFIFEKKDTITELPLFIDEFTPEETLIARYDYVPFESGKCKLPLVEVNCQAWNLVHQNIYLNSEEVIVADSKENPQDAELVESESFLLENDEDFEKWQKEMLYSDKTLSVKNYSEHFFKREKLFTFYKKLSLILICLFALSLIPSAFLKKKNLIITAGLLFFISFAFFLTFTMMLQKKHAQSSGGFMYQIPDEKSENKSYIEKGTLLSIESETDEWLQVTAGSENHGWIKKDSVEKQDEKK